MITNHQVSVWLKAAKDYQHLDEIQAKTLALKYALNLINGEAKESIATELNEGARFNTLNGNQEKTLALYLANQAKVAFRSLTLTDGTNLTLTDGTDLTLTRA